MEDVVLTDNPEVNALLIACSFQEEGQFQVAQNRYYFLYWFCRTFN